jgi:hypothetical protein
MKTMYSVTARTFLSRLSLRLLPVMLTGLAGLMHAQSASAQQALCCDKSASGKCVQTMSTMPARPMPSRVSELDRYADMHTRMDKLDTGNCALAYHLHKTQAWLNLSRDLHHEGDGRTASNAAYDEAEKIIKDLEAGKTPSSDTAMIQNAAKLRPDLWEMAANRKSTPSLLSSAAREVAYCEVYLVRAGHAQTNLGGRARVEPLIGMAQDVCQAAKDKAPCPVIAPPVASAPPAQAAQTAPIVSPAPAPQVAPVVVAPAPQVVQPEPAKPLPKRTAKQDRN